MKPINAETADYKAEIANLARPLLQQSIFKPVMDNCQSQTELTIRDGELVYKDTVFELDEIQTIFREVHQQTTDTYFKPQCRE